MRPDRASSRFTAGTGAPTVLLLALGLLSLVACGGVANAPGVTSYATTLSAYAGPQIGQVVTSPDASAAPALAGTDPITGRKVSLADYAGRPVVVNFWSSTCFPCNQEAPTLRQLERDHPETVVLGVDSGDTTGGARSFYAKWHLTHPSIADPDGNLAARYAVIGLPTTFFLDARHRIAARLLGLGSVAAFERGLALAGHAP